MAGYTELDEWTRQATAACKRATENGVLLMLRDDDLGAIATNATTPAAVRSLGEAWAGGYPGDSDWDDGDE